MFQKDLQSVVKNNFFKFFKPPIRHVTSPSIFILLDIKCFIESDNSTWGSRKRCKKVEEKLQCKGRVLTSRRIINERRTPQSGIPRSLKNLTYKHYFTMDFNALPETTSKYVPCCSPATSKTDPSATELSTTRPDKSTTFIVSPASTFST